MPKASAKSAEAMYQKYFDIRLDAQLKAVQGIMDHLAKVQKKKCPHDPEELCTVLSKWFKDFYQWATEIHYAVYGPPGDETKPPPPPFD